MKKTTIFTLLLTVLLFHACKPDYTNKAYLKKVLNNLEKIKSATYYIKKEARAPGDTAAKGIFYSYVKEFDNPRDTTIGAGFVSLKQSDTTQMIFSYDGNRRAVVYEEYKGIVIDSFNVRKLPFRPLTPPFFNYVKSIIKYALETQDSINFKITDLGDSVHMKLEIFENKTVEFFGKAYYIVDPFGFGDEVSRFDIWINKSNDLPYKVLREQPHDITSRTCSNVKLNTLDMKDFVDADYFQADYTVVPYGMAKRTEESVFLNKKAPDWILKDADNKGIAFKDLKSKVVLLQFTSVSCGPCRASVPFLKQLVTEYDQSDFDFVAIEAFTKNSNVLKAYQQKNRFDYKFLMSDKELNKSYHIQSVPVFFVLDENRVIRKVINGYGTSVDKQIRDAINELI